MTRMCVMCNKRPAKFKRHGEIKADKGHDMCLQCFRSIKDRLDQETMYQNLLRDTKVQEGVTI